MDKNLFVKLDEFERAFTIQDSDDVVSFMRSLMNRELSLVSTLPEIEHHDDKIIEYGKKIEVFKQTGLYRYRVLRNEEPMPVGSVEFMWVIALTGDGYVRFIHLTAIGAVHHLVTSPFYLFQPFFTEIVPRAIVVHTHPNSKVVEPSPADLAFTKNLFSITQPTHIELLDHVIIGREDAFSFKDKGLMEQLQTEYNAELEEKRALYREIVKMQKTIETDQQIIEVSEQVIKDKDKKIAELEAKLRAQGS